VSDATPAPTSPDPNAPAPSRGARFVPATIEELNASLPQYEFVELIGSGGMGAVYKARQPRLNRFVAIKILPPIADEGLGFAERFEREAQSMAQLSHPHIVAVYDYGETGDGLLYFVMEYVEGADLHRLISGGELTLDHFYGWIPQVCDAIQYAHDHGIVHRDIKPANILIDREGRVKIADFGLAKLMDPDNRQLPLTRTDLSMGTPDYAAPEQIDGGSPVDWRSDIYSLGVVMYQMLTGRLPRGAFPLPSEKTPGLDKRLDDVVIRAMQSEPAFRFQRASEIAHRLSEIWSQPESVAAADANFTAFKKTPHHPRPSASVWPLVGGIAGLSMLAGLVMLYLRHERQPESAPPRPKAAAIPDEKSPERSPRSTEKPAKVSQANATPKANKAGTEPPPRDFTRRPDPDGADPRPANLAAFRDKMGSRKPFGEKLDAMRRQQANLIAISKDGEPLKGHPLADLPKDLRPITRLALGQSPPGWDGPGPFAVALQVDGTVRAWGDPAEGRCDVPPAAAKEVIQIAAGPLHALALRRDGTVIAWGSDVDGQCRVPDGLSGVTVLAAGRNFSLALLADGTVTAWGAGPSAVAPAELAGVKAIAAGFDHALALRQDGTVVTWGGNEFGQLNAPPLGGVKAISANFGNSFALLDDGSLVGWGANGDDATSPGAKFNAIHGTGEALVARDQDDRLVVHGPKNRSGALPAMLRQLPREVEIEIADALLFAYRPAGGRESGATVPEPEPAQPQEPVTVTPAPAAPSEAGRQIEDLQAKFSQAYVEQVSGPHEDSLRQLNAFYLNHLEERQAAAAASGLLEEAVTWRSEAERVREGAPLPETDDPGLPADLIAIRRTYRENAAAHEATRRQAEAGLLAKYDEALQAMQDRFTREQKLDEALEVKAHRDERPAHP
jgi:serine/threonine protein kinase